MSEFITRRVEAYVERVQAEATVAYGSGKVMVDPRALLEIVRDEPREVTELVIRTQVMRYREGSPSRLQLALILAELYQMEFGDDRMLDLVRHTADGEAIPYGLQAPDGGYAEQEARLGRAPVLRVLTIENDDPQEGDVRNVIRVFGDLERQPSHARELRGLVSLSFPRYEDDPRPNFAIPEVRACNAALDAHLPYFLYYLIPLARAGQVMSLMNSLLPMELFEFPPGRWLYTGTAEEVIGLLIPRVREVRRFCELTGDDPDEVMSTVLQSYPEWLTDEIGTVLRSTGGL
jgi:hypothetical protein